MEKEITRYIPFSPPAIGEEEIAEVVDTLRSDWITTGPKTKRFEKEFASYVQAENAVALNSCTAALHLALAARGIGPGDEVITTPMTFAASVNVIEHVGAKPVLVDVEADTLNIDPLKVAEAITERTKAILPVHYAGHPAELDALRSLAESRDMLLLEDAAHAIAAEYRGRPIGAGTSTAAFSFYATKNLCTAEGGMLTGPAGLLERARVLGLHGMNRDAWNRYGKGGNWFYEVVAPGFKYNMTDIQASLGLVQLRRLEQLQQRRLEIAQRYQSAFGAEVAIEIPSVRSHVKHAWHLYVLRLRTESLTIDRDTFIEEMGARNIGTSVHFIPVHTHPYYRDKYGYEANAFPVAFGAYKRSVSLPLHPRLSDADQTFIIENVLDLCRKHRR